jgi:hypothetical protein
MAYDEALADRLRECLSTQTGLSERKMFGGLAFLINGRMAVAASASGGLLLRVEPAQTAALGAKPHAGPFVMRGRELDGWLRVDAAGVATKRQLERWVERGVSFAQSLPPK